MHFTFKFRNDLSIYINNIYIYTVPPCFIEDDKKYGIVVCVKG